MPTSSAGSSLAAYYHALATRTMSIVAPIAACGALLSVGLALAEGERPPLLSLGGALLAITGAVVASLRERRKGEANRQAIVVSSASGSQVQELGIAAAMTGVAISVLGAAGTY